MSNVVTQRLSFDQGKVKIETSIANQGQKCRSAGKQPNSGFQASITLRAIKLVYLEVKS